MTFRCKMCGNEEPISIDTFYGYKHIVCARCGNPIWVDDGLTQTSQSL